MKKKLSLRDLKLSEQKVLMRVDFNVPLNEQGEIIDDTRIKAAIPSIQYILDQGASLIIVSHLGRPKGKQLDLSLAPCAQRLADLLKKTVNFAPDCCGQVVQEMAAKLKPGQILMLENLRFYKEEEEPTLNPHFAKELASLADLYVNDAFGTAHRSHSSTAVITQYFPGRAASGFLMDQEIEFLGHAILEPKRPFYAIVGGKKVSSKLGILRSLLGKVDGLFIGGGMAYTFMLAKGISIGNSICEPELIDSAKEIMQICFERKIKLVLPVDVQAANQFSNEATVRLVNLYQGGIPDGYEGMDLGPESIRQFIDGLKGAATILWNGPLGVAEFPRFSQGTQTIAKALAASSAVTVVGGGDSIAAIQAAGIANQITHISTGGGASLEFIEYGTLPGIEALSDISEYTELACSTI